MATGQTVRKGKGQSNYSRQLKDNLKGLEKEALLNKETLDLALTGAAQPLLELPNILNVLVEEKRLEDIPKVQSLTSTISADLATFAPKAKRLKDSLDREMKAPVTNKDQATRKYGRIFAVSTQMLSLTNEVSDTATAAAAQVEQIIHPSETRAEVHL